MSVQPWIGKGISWSRLKQNQEFGCCDYVLYKYVNYIEDTSVADNEPRCSCRSRTSSVSPPRCFANRHAKFVTESMNSSAIDNSSCHATISDKEILSQVILLHLLRLVRSSRLDQCLTLNLESFAACSGLLVYSFFVS